MSHSRSSAIEIYPKVARKYRPAGAQKERQHNKRLERRDSVRDSDARWEPQPGSGRRVQATVGQKEGSARAPVDAVYEVDVRC